LSVPVTRFERDTLAIVLREPSVGSILIGKHFQTVGMIDPVIGIARPNLSGCILSGLQSQSRAGPAPQGEEARNAALVR
jgi:hypothetical protein